MYTFDVIVSSVYTQQVLSLGAVRLPNANVGTITTRNIRHLGELDVELFWWRKSALRILYLMSEFFWWSI